MWRGGAVLWDWASTCGMWCCLWVVSELSWSVGPPSGVQEFLGVETVPHSTHWNWVSEPLSDHSHSPSSRDAILLVIYFLGQRRSGSETSTLISLLWKLLTHRTRCQLPNMLISVIYLETGEMTWSGSSRPSLTQCMPNVVRILFHTWLLYGPTLTGGEAWGISCVWVLISIQILCPTILEMSG